MSREFVRRAALLGIIAWVSLCLIAIGLVPQLLEGLSPVLVFSGLLGLASAVGLLEVVKSEQLRHAAQIANRQQSRRDALTGLPNRWEFDRLINIMISDAQDHDLELSLLLIDVDGLHRINQSGGYTTGDEILGQVARLVITATRGADLLARYGDDEFAVVLADVDRPTCEQIMERVRTRVQETVRHQADAVSVSLGASSMLRDDPADQLIHRAELALFQSKSEGRNRCSLHDGEELRLVGRPATKASAAADEMANLQVH